MGTKKRAGLWRRLKGLWKKWRGRREFEGPTPSEDEVVDRFAEDYVRNVLWPQSRLFLQQIVVESNKAQLPQEYLPYVFWLLVEQRSEWPQMHKGQARALKFARDLTMSQADFPNYRPALQIPPVHLEALVDQILLRIGSWAHGPMVANLMRGLADTIKKWTPLMARATAESLPADKAGLYLQALFEIYLDKRPTHFLDGYLLEQAVFDLMP